MIEDHRDLKAVVSVIHVHIHNKLVPGPYRTELTRLLDEFNFELPDGLPDYPPSQKMFDVRVLDNITQEQTQDILKVIQPATELATPQ